MLNLTYRRSLGLWILVVYMIKVKPEFFHRIVSVFVTVLTMANKEFIHSFTLVLATTSSTVDTTVSCQSQVTQYNIHPTPHSSWSSVAWGYQDIRLAIFGQECRRTDNINNFLFPCISSFVFFLPLSHPRIWLLPFIVLQLKLQVIKIIDWQYWVRRVGVQWSCWKCFSDILEIVKCFRPVR